MQFRKSNRSIHKFEEIAQGSGKNGCWTTFNQIVKGLERYMKGYINHYKIDKSFICVISQYPFHEETVDTILNDPFI